MHRGVEIRTSSIMESYRHRELPSTLYRVHHPGAQASYSDDYGFNAASNFLPLYLTGLQDAVGNHLDWEHRRFTSPFISTFDNKQHAVRWAQRWYENNDDNDEMCYIMEINIEEENEDDVIAFRVTELVNRLGLSIPWLKPSQYRSEYLFYRQIPSKVIVDVEPVRPGTNSEHSLYRQSY
ncbi:hypothetical protein M408DRAFT_249169 [Serendipita vermifera MAFF 305830]|uniref:DUF7587 domain-containing protein n=1 Tax=Serendipita vermifera MAFF 305830 TaxID=933852 RepID=A0A0C2WBL8_SERVB|nr:hypothetical protein M408DRAFT_249169 [Serendipita vermifera MAFF 305830]